MNHAMRHIEHAIMYLGNGFGETPHLTCYTTAAVLNDLQLKDLVKSEYYTDLNTPAGRNFKKVLTKDTALLRKLTQGQLTNSFISSSIYKSNLIIISHDTAGMKLNPSSMRGFALCNVGTLTDGSGIMELLLIGNAEHCAMNIRSKVRPKGCDVLNEVMKLGRKLEHGIRVEAVGKVIPFYWKHGFRFRRNCRTDDTGSDTDTDTGDDTDAGTINQHIDEQYREAVNNLSQFTKSHTNRFVSKTMRMSAKYKAEQDNLKGLLRPFLSYHTGPSERTERGIEKVLSCCYKMILCQDKNPYSKELPSD